MGVVLAHGASADAARKTATKAAGLITMKRARG
jgi:hypothetical protein